VDGLIVLELNVWVTLAAGGGDVQGIDTGFGVCGAFQGMNAVAIGAGCCGSHPPGRALSMNGHGILLEGLGQTNQLVGQEPRLTVTFGAGIGKANFMGGGTRV
jgi:hypothetical protein